MSQRVVRAVAFVLVAVIATVVLARAVTGTGDDEATASRTVAATAAPESAQPAPPARSVAIVGTKLSPQELADQASLATGADEPPLRVGDFDRPIAQYRRYAAARVGTLQDAAGALRRAVAAGDRAAARRAWDRSDSALARIGAAYGALGALGDRLSGALGRLESTLWRDGRPSPTDARTVVRAADRLRRVLRSSPIDPLTYATRAHEILEDVQRDRLSTPTPSGSGVRATADGVAATRAVLTTLKPLLDGRGDAQAESLYWIGALGRTLHRIQREHGGRYPAVGALSHRDTQLLNGRLGAALEALGGIPGQLETTLPPTITPIP